ncbi:MAG TPA: methyl-accepting chemotaxis protein [Xenococcaceae cyanobacterium]
MKINFFQSLRFRMPLLIVVGIMPPTIATIMWVSQDVKTLIEEKSQTTLALEAQALDTSTSSWVEKNVLALNNLSQQPAIQSLSAPQQEPVLAAFTQTYPDIYLAHTLDTTGVNIARSDGEAPQDYRDRLYYQNAITDTAINYQTLIDPTSQKPSLCFATPIKQETTIAGVASICTLLDRLAEPVGAIRIGETGYGFVIDNLGQVLAHPNPNLASEETLTNLSNYPPVQNLLAGNEGYYAYTDEQGIEWVAHGNLLANGWGVLILQHRAEAFAQKYHIQNITTIIAALALVAVGALTWLVADTLIKPIRQLTTAALNFAEGKLDTTINIVPQDELGVLTLSFNQMAQQLQESFATIEERSTKLDNLLQDKQEAEQAQRIAKEQLQLEVQKLRTQLESVSQGDLTIPIEAGNNEIGILAQYYDQTRQNLQQIVTEIKNTTQVVTQATTGKENTIEQLSQDTLQQTEEIAAILSQVQRMTESVQLVAANAQEAEMSIKKTTAIVEQGDATLNATVAKIVALGESTTTAKEQVQKLGKASRRISKAVELIRKIALQTNVLAVNASIEAARAGQEGMGFNVVAEEVQSLAAGSAKTATEIEKLVLEIQNETNKVVKVMEKNHQEILEGSQAMQKTRAFLHQVTNASLEVDRLIEVITRMAVEQSQTSQDVTNTMVGVAAIANRTCDSATDVSNSFAELLQVAAKLQDSIGQFKVN